MGSDLPKPLKKQLYITFQSTLPAWGATFRADPRYKYQIIFQSTLPAWGATFGDFSDLPSYQISIHAPRMGSDVRCVHEASLHDRFQSTLPAWGATFPPLVSPRGMGGKFQSTLPAWGATS